MKLTREEALKYHRQMWTDMQTELGDDPSLAERTKFKRSWCESHFPDCDIYAHCFLCEYALSRSNAFNDCCQYCPIDWGKSQYGDGCITGKVRYGDSPISEILSLPERDIDG